MGRRRGLGKVRKVGGGAACEAGEREDQKKCIRKRKYGGYRRNV